MGVTVWKDEDCLPAHPPFLMMLMTNVPFISSTLSGCLASLALWAFSFRTFLPFLLGNYPTFSRSIEVISHTANKTTIAMPANDAVVTIKTDDTPNIQIG